MSAYIFQPSSQKKQFTIRLYFFLVCDSRTRSLSLSNQFEIFFSTVCFSCALSRLQEITLKVLLLLVTLPHGSHDDRKNRSFLTTA